MRWNIFKAYDIRGNYPEEINARTIEAVAEVLGMHFWRGLLILGHDGRTSSPALSFAVKRGLRASRAPLKVLDVGMATTPMFYFLVNRLKAIGGIMVTASHNPKGMNGLKVVGKGAVPLGGTEILRLVKRSHVR